MRFTSKTLTCSYCGTMFIFDREEQRSFAMQGYINNPRRCPRCRLGRKAGQGGGFGYYANFSTLRMMYPATCAECGIATEVPFEPLDERSVYCRRCRNSLRSASSR